MKHRRLNDGEQKHEQRVHISSPVGLVRVLYKAYNLPAIIFIRNVLSTFQMQWVKEAAPCMVANCCRCYVYVLCLWKQLCMRVGNSQRLPKTTGLTRDEDHENCRRRSSKGVGRKAITLPEVEMIARQVGTWLVNESLSYCQSGTFLRSTKTVSIGISYNHKNTVCISVSGLSLSCSK